jgi:hypothetical protein
VGSSPITSTNLTVVKPPTPEGWRFSDEAYVYAGDDPINEVDPSGLSTPQQCGPTKCLANPGPPITSTSPPAPSVQDWIYGVYGSPLDVGLNLTNTSEVQITLLSEETLDVPITVGVCPGIAGQPSQVTSVSQCQPWTLAGLNQNISFTLQPDLDGPYQIPGEAEWSYTIVAASGSLLDLGSIFEPLELPEPNELGDGSIDQDPDRDAAFVCESTTPSAILTSDQGSYPGEQGYPNVPPLIMGISWYGEWNLGAPYGWHLVTNPHPSNQQLHSEHEIQQLVFAHERRIYWRPVVVLYPYGLFGRN